MPRKAAPRNTPAKPTLTPAPTATRVILTVLGATLLLGALLSPWWTRGMDIDEEKLYADGDGADTTFFLGVAPGAEGIYFNYGPFTTPGFQGTSFDAGREAAVAVLGIALVTCALLCATVVGLRWLTATGRVAPNLHVPVRLAIAAFLAGLVAVLWGAFFVPLAGDNPGMMYGDEDPQFLSEDTEGILEMTRYANVGFFLGIAGAIGFPAYLWIDAARARFLAGEPTPKATDSWIATTA